VQTSLYLKGSLIRQNLPGCFRIRSGGKHDRLHVIIQIAYEPFFAAFTNKNQMAFEETKQQVSEFGNPILGNRSF